MQHFYFVADYTARYYLDVDNVLISAGSSWLNGKWFDWQIKGIKRLFVDSGGFQFFRKWGDFPFTLDTYIEYVFSVKDQYPLELCATMDYPCEIEVNRAKYKTNTERIEATVNNAVTSIDAAPSLPWIPVIQGYRLNEYLECIEQYEDKGIDLSYAAIGSVCARKGNLYSIRRIISKLSERTSGRLHAFGLSLTYLRDPQIFNALYSSDSAAWNWGISKHQDKAKAVSDYLLKINSLQHGFQGQTSLEGMT